VVTWNESRVGLWCGVMLLDLLSFRPMDLLPGEPLRFQGKDGSPVYLIPLKFSLLFDRLWLPLLHFELLFPIYLLGRVIRWLAILCSPSSAFRFLFTGGLWDRTFTGCHTSGFPSLYFNLSSRLTSRTAGRVPLYPVMPHLCRCRGFYVLPFL